MFSPKSKEVTTLAKKILSAQSYVPKSPAARDENGKPVLCLAAAVVVAGLLVLGFETRANKLTEELIRTQSKSVLEQSYIQIGWKVEVCKDQFAMNDSFSDSTRKDDVLNYLDDV
jgi:hypothetical protein